MENHQMWCKFKLNKKNETSFIKAILKIFNACTAWFCLQTIWSDKHDQTLCLQSRLHMMLRENYGNLPDAIELLTVVCATHISQLDMAMCCKKLHFFLSLDEQSSTSSHCEITAIKKCWTKNSSKRAVTLSAVHSHSNLFLLLLLLPIHFTFNNWCRPSLCRATMWNMIIVI